MKRNENGRSMVEMLGVLAIIGVLSVGGIYGYTVAMRKYKANEIIQAASMMATIAHSRNAGEGAAVDSLAAAGLNAQPGGVDVAMQAAAPVSGVVVVTLSAGGAGTGTTFDENLCAAVRAIAPTDGNLSGYTISSAVCAS